MGTFLYTSRFISTHTDEHKRLTAQRFQPTPKPPHVPSSPIFAPGIEPLKLPGLCEWKNLPTWQFLTPIEGAELRTRWRLLSNTAWLAYRPHEDKKTSKLSTFVPASLGPVTR
jgi:hypothetical protein